MTHHGSDFDIAHAIGDLTVPAYILDREGRLQWQNRGSIELIGDRVGEHFSRLVPAEELPRLRTVFAKKLIGGAEVTEVEVDVVDAEGRRRAFRVTSVPLRNDGRVVGVFGLAYPARTGVDGEVPKTGGRERPDLTEREHEALVLLAEGLGTPEIAARLGVAEETARNHIRRLFRRLDVHSRLEAVVAGYRLGLLKPPRDD
jgi:DNA-binding CsgD family transcriptional regulator